MIANHPNCPISSPCQPHAAQLLNAWIVDVAPVGLLVGWCLDGERRKGSRVTRRRSGHEDER